MTIHFSSALTGGRDDWTTPPEVFAKLDAEYGPFTLDAAADGDNALCPSHFTVANDALTQPWSGLAFCNPPYSRVAAFVQHAIREVEAGHVETVVLLVPARPDSIWWREAFEHADEVHVHAGRLRFDGSNCNAPFGSCVFVLRRRRQRTWKLDGATRYSMPKRHKQPRWYPIKNRDTNATNIGGAS